MAPPHHWSLRYVGRPYDEHAFDCADLVIEVVQARTGRHIALPCRAAGLRGRDRQIAAVAAEEAAPVPAPADGDIALMCAAGRRADVGRHVGIYCDVAGAGHILHCVAGMGVCLHPLAGLATRGFRVLGYYRLAS